MRSCDRKCIGGVEKWLHAVRILLAIILVFAKKSVAQKLSDELHLLETSCM